MEALVALLDPPVLVDLRRTLARGGFPELRSLRDETIATLLGLGLDPAEGRPATLSLTPLGIRSELHAHGLAGCRRRGSAVWELTESGTAAADLLAAQAPPLRPDVAERASEQLADVLAHGQAQLDAHRG